MTADKTPQGVVIKADGKPFAEYIVKSGSKPIVWPVFGPTGKRVTRNWPLENGVPESLRARARDGRRSDARGL